MATFTNQATLSYNGNTINSNITTGELVEALTATKTAVEGSYAAGEAVTYVISIVNTGETAVTGVTVSDDLGGYAAGGTTVYPLRYVEGSVLYYVNGVLQATPTVTEGPPLVVSGLSVPAGGNIQVVYETRVTEYAPLDVGGTIRNTATVTGAGLTDAVTATETVNTRDLPQISVNKSMNPVSVSPGDRLTYTFTIQNTGNTALTAEDAVVLTDTFNPALSGITVTFNGTAWTEPANYTYNETTGLFSTVAGQITVPAATYTQDPATGAWSVNPGVSTLTVSGTV